MGALYKRVIKGEYKPIPKQYSVELSELIDRMLIVRATDRISISKLKPMHILLSEFRGTVAASINITDRQ